MTRHGYLTRLKATGATQAVLASPGAVPLPVSAHWDVDVEVEMEDWNPETLLIASVEAYVMRSFFKELARRGIEIGEYQSVAEFELEQDDDGGLHLVELVIRPSVRILSASDSGAIQEIFETVPVRSFVCGLLKSLPKIQPEIASVVNSNRLQSNDLHP